MIINDPAVLLGLAAAFALYEATLTANDMATVDALLHDDAKTSRFRIGELLYGFAELAPFRRARPGGFPARRALRRRVTTYGTDFVITYLEFQRTGSTRYGRQSESCIWIGQSRKIVAAHASLMGTHA